MQDLQDLQNDYFCQLTLVESKIRAISTSIAKNNFASLVTSNNLTIEFDFEIESPLQLYFLFYLLNLKGATL